LSQREDDNTLSDVPSGIITITFLVGFTSPAISALAATKRQRREAIFRFILFDFIVF
jgi:hypothetical protein